MENVYTIDELRKARKANRAREWVHRRANDAANWFYNNKEMVMLLGPAAIGAATTVVKVIGKNVNLRKEKSTKDLYCYDRSLGHYWALRRELTNAEWVEIDKRKNKGERLADILSELRVLK